MKDTIRDKEHISPLDDDYNYYHMLDNMSPLDDDYAALKAEYDRSPFDDN